MRHPHTHKTIVKNTKRAVRLSLWWLRAHRLRRLREESRRDSGTGGGGNGSRVRTGKGRYKTTKESGKRHLARHELICPASPLSCLRSAYDVRTPHFARIKKKIEKKNRDEARERERETTSRLTLPSIQIVDLLHFSAYP